MKTGLYLSVGEQDLDEVPEDEPDVVLAADSPALEDLQEDLIHVVDVDAVPEELVVVFVGFLKKNIPCSSTGLKIGIDNYHHHLTCTNSRLQIFILIFRDGPARPVFHLFCLSYKKF